VQTRDRPRPESLSSLRPDASRRVTTRHDSVTASRGLVNAAVVAAAVVPVRGMRSGRPHTEITFGVFRSCTRILRSSRASTLFAGLRDGWLLVGRGCGGSTQDVLVDFLG
jgi:hypothetical protein